MAERVLRLSFYPWITQGVAIEEISRQVRLFADVLSEKLTGLGGGTTYRVKVIDPQDVPVQVTQVANGECEIALMNPLGYVFANRRNPKRVKAAAIALRETDGKVGPTYFAQIYTLKKTGIRDVKSARSRSLGFGAPFSTSNFLIPASFSTSRACTRSPASRASSSWAGTTSSPRPSTRGVSTSGPGTTE